MINHMVDWIKAEMTPTMARGRWARWIGRGWAKLSYAMTVEPTWLELNELEVPIANLGKGLEGLRIVQMSDFHCSAKVTPEYLGEAVELAIQQKPDLIALTGDFIHAGFKHVHEAADVLSHLKAPLGVWAVLGNHDYSVRNAMGRRKYPHLHQSVTDALVKKRIHVLENDSVLFTRGGSRLYLVGLADLWSRAFDPFKALAGLAPNIPRLIMAHNPCSIEHLHGQRCDLMLSGHTHGGQINLPRLGRVALGKNGKRYAAGLYRCGNGHLYVNKGVGYGSFPIRFNVRPEVSAFTLVPLQTG